MFDELNIKQKKILDLASDCFKFYKKEIEKFPYHINIIEELHDNENAHSRILMKLLQYRDNGRYTLLESFIDYMSEVSQCRIEILIDTPIITHGKEYIDGLIEERGKYAIIIENKIWDAVDQNKQIETYVKTVNKRVKKEKIFVVYLTKDGSKIVSDYSLTQSAKELLQDRFIPMNYKNHILPWLKESVLPNCKVKEEFMRSAVHQYIDYLEYINGLNDYQQQAKSNTLKHILKNMEISEDKREQYLQLTEKINEIRELENILNSRIEKMGKEAVDALTEITKEYFDSVEDFQCGITDRLIRNGWYQVYDKRWDENVFIHLEWIPVWAATLFEQNEYTLVLHVEGERTKDFGELLKSNEELQMLNNGVSINDKTTFFSKSFPTQNGKPFGIMTREEQREYLYGVYGSYEIKKVIEIVFETIEQMNNTKQDNGNQGKEL